MCICARSGGSFDSFKHFFTAEYLELLVAKSCLHTPAHVSTRQHTSAHVSTRQHTPAHVSTRQHMFIRQLAAKSCLDMHLLESLFEEGVGGCGLLARWRNRQHPLAARCLVCAIRIAAGRLGQRIHAAHVAPVSIRQHTSAYVSIRQHTPAYVSIRQHTSAYVNVRLGQSIYAADVAPWQTINFEGLSRQMLKLL
jgi:hypothetical protein